LSFRPGNSSKTKISLTYPKPPEILRELNQEPIGGGTRSSRTNYNPRISKNSEQYFKKKPKPIKMAYFSSHRGKTLYFTGTHMYLPGNTNKISQVKNYSAFFEFIEV